MLVTYQTQPDSPSTLRITRRIQTEDGHLYESPVYEALTEREARLLVLVLNDHADAESAVINETLPFTQHAA